MFIDAARGSARPGEQGRPRPRHAVPPRSRRSWKSRSPRRPASPRRSSNAARRPSHARRTSAPGSSPSPTSPNIVEGGRHARFRFQRPSDPRRRADRPRRQGHPAKEFDSMGTVEVPADKYYGAQTARSLVHFSIGDDKMPMPVYHAYGVVKKACALVNRAEGRLADWKADAIIRAADETIAGKLDAHYPHLRLADRFGHAVEHERQRGSVEPSDPAARRQARHPGARRPQRRRQHGPVEQRHFSVGDAHRGRRGDRR